MIAVQELGALPIMIGGSDEQKRRWLPDLASGKKLGGVRADRARFGLRRRRLDAHQGACATATTTSSTASKIWITNGSVADVITVFAVTDPTKGPNGISAFVVEKGTPGFSVGKLEKKMGIRGSPTVELAFENCRIPAANMLGDEGDGFKIAMKVLDKSRPGIAAQALGIAQGALDYATEYTKQRVAFGKPISQQQGLQFMLADMKTEVEAARLLLYEAARKCDENARRRHDLGRDGEAEVRRHRDERDDRRRAAAGRLRLLDGIPGRADDARREDHADLRRHAADPAASSSPGRWSASGARQS